MASNGSDMWLRCLLCVLVSEVFSQNTPYNPNNNYPYNPYNPSNNNPNFNPNHNNNNNPYDNHNNPMNSQHFTAYGGQQLHIRIREPEQRDPSNCEPYEDMFIDDDDCRIYCMVNGKIGNVLVRDRVRRALRQCVPSSNPCSLCQRRVYVNGLPQSVNASLPGRCTDDCRCLSAQISSSQLQESITECAALKSIRFQPVRKVTQGGHTDGFEVNFPTADRRDRTRCEPYETTTYNLPVGSQEVYDLQCRTYCVVSGTIGAVVIKSAPRLLSFSVNNQCRQPTGASLFNSIEVQGSQEQLMGFCQRGSCGQLSRNNLRPKSSYGRPGSFALTKDTKDKKEVNVTDVDGGITVENY